MMLSLGGSSWLAQDKAKSQEQAVAEGLKYLIKNQGDNGRWGHDEGRWYGVKDKVAIYAITSIGLLALKANLDVKIESGDKAIQAALKYIASYEGKVEATKGFDLRHWDSAFVLFTLVRLYKEKSGDEVKNRIEKLIDVLESSQETGGGWAYMSVEKDKSVGSSATFLTSNCLIVLLHAKEAGFKVKEETIKSAVGFLKKRRSPSGAFGYYLRDHFADGEIGSCARNVPNELALYLAGESDQKRLQWAVSQFFIFRNELEATRKKWAIKGKMSYHQGKEGIASYYFFFSYFWAVQALHFVDKEAAIRMDAEGKTTKTPAECISELKRLVLELQEGDGSWFDNGMPGIHYGTAMALLVLSDQNLIR